ncbi:hypothetical protein CDA63_15910 [Hymenobacter amundsenii]|uniref:Glycosyltransferase RgtA/B/C/D-like domain-containing protein n=1 Tax=Hymenobacter amundsenii TaxID=2006685 RepID=A0A246FHY7_9BACT|nr:hypothetical protein [Hymenobacter amundsenii]OWP62134.1 hypothetical protein CDA63_15910 [Hymenobacter amundsenii]
MPDTYAVSLHWPQWLLVYLLALGLVAGPAYPMYRHYDFSHSRDTLSYLSVARGEFDGVSITRRYRVLVPAAAAAVAWPLEQVYARIWPQRPGSEWPLRLGFYVVNCLLLAGAGLVMFQTCRLCGASPLAAALALAAVLTSRWTVYLAGLPLVDSLYLLVFALAFYAVRAGSAGAVVAVLLLALPAKESGLLLVPWLLWFGRRALAWPYQLAWLALGGAAWLALRLWIDQRAGAAPADSMNNALGHLENISYSLGRLFSVKGAGEIFSIFGFFSLAVLVGLRNQMARLVWLPAVGWSGAWLLVIIAGHMLLSGDLGRMGYLSAPVFAVAFALIISRNLLFKSSARIRPI